ncbi:hypothetical protein THAOC_14801, partial [Thalassiosira oceanica]
AAVAARAACRNTAELPNRHVCVSLETVAGGAWTTRDVFATGLIPSADLNHLTIAIQKTYVGQLTRQEALSVLKPGDWIEYYHCTDDGLTTEQIIQINDPSKSPNSVVVVNDMYTIGRTSEVRLVQRLLPNDSLEQVSGVRRPVSKFILKCGGDIGGLGGLVIANAKLVKERNKRRRDNTMKKMGQDGTDIFSDMLL